MTDQPMTKVHVSLPNHWAVGGESLWATPVEGEPEHYRVENIPYYVYGVALGDVVRAVDTAEHPREIVAVVRPSGGLTYRLFFDEGVDDRRQVEILRSIHEEHGVRMEKGFPQFWALNLPAEALDPVVAILDRLREEGVLEMESGHPRAEGSFDAEPGQE